MNRWILTFLCLISLWVVLPISGEESSKESDVVTTHLLSEEESIQPGRPFWVAIHMKIADDWHTYWKNPGDTGMAPSINWELPPGFTIAENLWLTPQRFVVQDLVGFGYEGDNTLLVKITPPSSNSEKSVKLSYTLSWLACSNDSCLPGESMGSITLPFEAKPPTTHPKNTIHFSQAREQLPQKQPVQVFHQDGLIAINLEKSIEEISGAYFCPEAQTIDQSFEPNVDGSGSTVILKAQDKQLKQLKGVLVLFKGSIEEPIVMKAIEIDSPIQSSHEMPEHAIAMLEKAKVSSNDSISSAGIGSGHEFIIIVGLAFIGGMILNLMPCVLPIISLKILNFVQLSGQSRASTLKHGMVFSFGVLVSFWLLAALLLLLQAYGHAIGWGFQLQEPVFVAALAALLLALSLNMFGIFEMGNSIISVANKAHGKLGGNTPGLWNSFFSGVLATAVATPCTGPFLGSAIGFAVGAPSYQAMMIFTSLGLGMALPYIILSGFPRLTRFLPKPGPWMNTFKEIMGFLMLATVLWLAWVYGAQTDNISLLLLLAAFFVLAVGCWIYGKWGTPLETFAKRTTSRLLALLCIVLSGYIIMTATHEAKIEMAGEVESEWQSFSPELIADLQNQGKPIIIDFTAKWCLICQVNHLVLTSEAVTSKLNEFEVVKVKADWTRNNPVITEELKKHGRNGVPLYLLYSGKPGSKPKVLPQVLTPENVIQELKNL